MELQVETVSDPDLCLLEVAARITELTANLQCDII